LKVSEGFSQLNQRLKKYVQVTDLETVIAKFEKYAPLESLTEFESRVKPLLSSAEKLLDEFRFDNNQMKECVLQFDETLSLKADRWNIE
jgi:hypothetical protein